MGIRLKKGEKVTLTKENKGLRSVTVGLAGMLSLKGYSN
mgnify:CR=1 FL=1